MLGGGKLDRLGRIEFARIVDTVGKQDQHALVLWTLAQALDRKPDCVADRGLTTGQADDGFVQLLEHGVAIEG